MKLNRAVVYYYEPDSDNDTSTMISDLMEDDSYAYGSVFDIESIEIGDFQDTMLINMTDCTKEDCERFFETYRKADIQPKPEPCNHTKVFSELIMLSNPPKQGWICSVCGEQGIEVVGNFTRRDSAYQNIVQKFKKG